MTPTVDAPDLSVDRLQTLLRAAAATAEARGPQPLIAYTIQPAVVVALIREVLRARGVDPEA